MVVSIKYIAEDLFVKDLRSLETSEGTTDGTSVIGLPRCYLKCMQAVFKMTINWYYKLLEMVDFASKKDEKLQQS
jgi:hypothetical protein